MALPEMWDRKSGRDGQRREAYDAAARSFYSPEPVMQLNLWKVGTEQAEPVPEIWTGR